MTKAEVERIVRSFLNEPVEDQFPVLWANDCSEVLFRYGSDRPALTEMQMFDLAEALNDTDASVFAVESQAQLWLGFEPGSVTP